MSKDDYMTIHGGYDRQFVTWKIPNLVIPLDALRKLQKEGVFGELYPLFCKYNRNWNSYGFCQAKKFGDEIGKKLVEEHARCSSSCQHLRYLYTLRCNDG